MILAALSQQRQIRHAIACGGGEAAQGTLEVADTIQALAWAAIPVDVKAGVLDNDARKQRQAIDDFLARLQAVPVRCSL